MKRFMSGLATVALVALSSVSAMAGVWLDNNRSGSIAGSFDSFTPTSGSLAGALTAKDFYYSPGSINRTGAFAGITEVNSLVWDTAGFLNFDASGLTVGDAYTFSSSSFGTFVGTITGEVVNNLNGDILLAGSRQLNFVGTFTPGGNSHYEGDTATLTNVTLQINFSRNASPNGTTSGSINASWSMDTAGAAPVPEPTSMAIFGLGAAGLAFRRYRRK